MNLDSLPEDMLRLIVAEFTNVLDIGDLALTSKSFYNALTSGRVNNSCIWAPDNVLFSPLGVCFKNGLWDSEKEATIPDHIRKLEITIRGYNSVPVMVMPENLRSLKIYYDRSVLPVDDYLVRNSEFVLNNKLETLCYFSRMVPTKKIRIDHDHMNIRVFDPNVLDIAPGVFIRHLSICAVNSMDLSKSIPELVAIKSLEVIAINHVKLPSNPKYVRLVAPSEYAPKGYINIENLKSDSVLILKNISPSNILNNVPVRRIKILISDCDIGAVLPRTHITPQSVFHPEFTLAYTESGISTPPNVFRLTVINIKGMICPDIQISIKNYFIADTKDSVCWIRMPKQGNVYIMGDSNYSLVPTWEDDNTNTTKSKLFVASKHRVYVAEKNKHLVANLPEDSKSA